MNFLKKLGRALLYPHVAILTILVPVSICLLVYALVFLGSESIGSYFIYAVVAYTVLALCFRTPRIIRFCRNIQNENKLVSRLTTDEYFRTNLTLFGSLVWNMAYAVFQLGLGLFHDTMWYCAFAAYYAILGIMRFFLFKHSKKYAPGEKIQMELRRYRFCGILLALMNLALMVIVGFMVAQHRTFVHHQITTITMATYTFTALTVAVVNLIKHRKHKSPVFSATKAINFAAAMVSILTLTTTMLTAFGDETTEISAPTMLGLTGAGVLLTILAMSIIMIVQATKRLKNINVNGDNKND